MTNLLYYHIERLTFSEIYEEKVNLDKAKMIIKKLIKHFKLRNVDEIETYSGKGAICRYFKCQIPYCKIIIPKKEMSIGLICHELAHAWELLKYRKAGHNKKHTKFMKRITNYCKKKNYWKEEQMEEIEIK